MSIRNNAFFIHLSASALLLAFLTIWVLVSWYAPWPLLSIQGGLKILAILIGVDVILGPALTWLVFKPEKSRKMLIFDLSVIVFVQLAALSYGTWALYSQRPLFLAFVSDRFEVARAGDLDLTRLDKDLLPENYRGARPVLVDLPASYQLEIMLARRMKDQSLGIKQQYYREFPGNRKPEQLAMAAKKPPENSKALTSWLDEHHLSSELVLLFPVIGQNGSAMAVVSRKNGEFIGLLNEYW